MKKLILILFIIPLLVRGQVIDLNVTDTVTDCGAAVIDLDKVYFPMPLNELNFYWDGKIRASDSTLFNNKTNKYDENFKLLSFDGDLTDRYLSTKSAGYLKIYNDTIPLTCIFSNYNYADTLFFQIKTQTLNSDSTEILPRRITEIAYYNSEVSSADSSRLWAYFSVPLLALNGYAFVGTNEDDLSTIESAISEASANDTIYVRSGIYVPSSTLTINKTLTLIGIGKADIRTASGTYAVQFSADNINFENFMLNGGTVSGIYCVTNSGQIIRNCYLTGFTNYCVFDRTPNTWYDCYLNAQETTNALYSQANSSYYNFKITGISAQPPIYVLASSGTPNIKYYWWDIEAAGAATTYDNIFRFRYAGVYAIKFCNIHDLSGQMFYEDANIENTIYIDYNKINITAPSHIINFTTSNNAGYFYLRNNTITNAGDVNTIYVDAFKEVRIDSNTIINTGNARCIYVANGTDSALIRANLVSLYGTSASIIRIGDGIGNESYYCLVEKNKILGSEYFDSEATSTSHAIFNYSVRNQITRYNYIEGANLAVVYKGDSVNNTSALIAYNIAIGNNLISKGHRNVKFYGNTVIRNEAIHIMNNDDVKPTDYDASGCEIKNNILYNTTGDPVIYIEHSESESGLDCDYNVLYNNDTDSLILKQSTYYGFSGWQGQGYDANSYNSNPNLTNYIPIAPSDAIDQGIDLGINYDNGLNIISSWPGSVITKQQGINWEIGVYIVNDE